MKKSRVWQAIVPGTQNKPQDTLQIRKTPWHGVTKQPPAVPLPGPNVTPEPNEKIKGLAANCSRHTKQATRHPSNQENTLARRDETASCPEPNEKIKGLAGNCSRHTNQATRRPSNQETPWHGVTKQPPALNRMKKSRVWQAIVPGTQTKPQDTLQIRKTPWHGVTKQPPALNRMKKSRVWQAIVPQNKPQDTLQIRKTPWHGVTKQPPAVPLPGPNVTPEPNEKIKGLAGNCSRHTKQATRHPSNQENTWHGVTKQPPAVPLPGPNVTPEPNEKIESRVWQAIVPGTQNKPQDTLQIRKTPWHGVTKQPPAVPLPGPNVTPEPNEKIKDLAGNCSRHTK